MSHAMQSHPRQARVKSSNKMCTTGGGNGDTPVFLGQEPYEQYENAKDMTPEDKRARPHPPSHRQVRRCSVGVSGGKSKVGCCKEQYCTGTWNVRLMNQGKLDMVKQEMARMNIDILRISELKWIVDLIQMTIVSTTEGKNPLEEIE